MEGDGCFPAMVMFALFLGLVLLGSGGVREWRDVAAMASHERTR